MNPRDESLIGSGAVLGEGSHRADADYAKAREHVAMSREAAALDRAEIAAGQATLRAALEGEYAPGMRLVNQYLDALSPAEREKIESAVLPNGTRLLNDPDSLIRLGMQAIGLVPRDPQGIEREIAALEGRMQVDRRAWFKDERAQMRLRFLYRLREGNK